MSLVLVTGATGFIGRSLIAQLAGQRDVTAIAGVRTQMQPSGLGGHRDSIVIDLNDPESIASAQLHGISCIIHLAAQVHIRNPNAELLASYVTRNVTATEQLARAAVKCGVRRFVFLSSIKVHGDKTVERPFRFDDTPSPTDAYGQSKLAAEQALWHVASGSGLEVTVVRPPLVYGPGVRANFLSLMRWIERGLPLPLGAINNRRSLVSVWNLCDLLAKLVNNPIASGRTWLVSDDDDLSTPDLARRIGMAMGKRVKLPSIPVGVLRIAGLLTARGSQVSRLCDSLSVDITQTRKDLGWAPAMTSDEALVRTVDWYMSDGRLRAT
jgi:nucleoside-diphosphate-sugar epimerase